MDWGYGLKEGGGGGEGQWGDVRSESPPVWKWLIGILVLLLLVLGVGGYVAATSPQFAKYRKEFSGKPKMTEVRLEPATKGTLIRTVSAPGSIECETAVKISAQVSAKEAGLPFEEGDDVKKEDVIVRLD